MTGADAWRLRSGLPWDSRAVAFHVAVPLALALIAATETGYNRTLGYGGALIYVALLSLVPWWIAEGATRLVRRALARWKPPLWVLTSLGALLACVAVHPYVSAVASLFNAHWPGGAELRAEGAGGRMAEGLMQVARAVAFWVAANYAFDRLFGFPRFRYERASSGPHAASPERRNEPARSPDSSGLAARLGKVGSLREIVLVKAEQHYVRVRSATAEELLHYRFSAALDDLAGEDGLRVHRSHWVRRSAVAEVVRDDSRLTLRLADGTSVPVSRAYNALVEQALVPMLRRRPAT